MDDAGGGLRGLRASPSQRLADAVSASWGIIWDSDAVDLGGSSNLNLLVGDGDRRSVVRVYRPHVTPERLRAIHVVRDRLSTAGIPCGGLLRTHDGSDWIAFQDRLVEVERYVEHDAAMDSWDHLERGMALLGRMHEALRTVDIGLAGRAPMFANHVEASESLDRTLIGTRRIRSWDASAIELQLASDAEALAKLVWARERTYGDALPRGLAHGDFWDDNVLFRSGEIVFVTDFDFMGFRGRTDDLALTLFFTCMEFFELPVSDDQLGRLSTLVDAYDAAAMDHPLTRTERKALPFAIARQPLWSIGVWVASLDDETAARRHAATMPTEVQWALRLMSEAERWQAAFS